MALVRETVYAALFTKLQTISGFNLYSRQFKPIGNVLSSDFPALFLVETSQAAIYSVGNALQWDLGADVYIYTTDASPQIAIQIMNSLVDGLQNVLAVDNTLKNACTLGGLVINCEIGEIQADMNTTGAFSSFRVPIKMRVRG